MPVKYYLEDDQGRIYGPGAISDTGRSVTFDTQNVTGTRIVIFLARHDTDNDVFDQFTYAVVRRPILGPATKTLVVTLPPSFMRKDEELQKKGRPAGNGQDDLQNVWKMI